VVCSAHPTGLWVSLYVLYGQKRKRWGKPHPTCPSASASVVRPPCRLFLAFLAPWREEIRFYQRPSALLTGNN
jgi:hypothetical protein